MSFSLTFRELVNVAIPQCGVVNFKALHLLLQAILDHVHLAQLEKVLSGDEDFLQTSPASFLPREADGPPTTTTPMKRLSNVFDHVVSRIDKVESQLATLQALPSTAQLLESSTGTQRPIEDLYHLIKLRKIVEGNEEAMAKSIQTLQDLLSNTYELKVAVETLRKDVDGLQAVCGKIQPGNLDALLSNANAQNQKVNVLHREMMALRAKVQSIPTSKDTVLWTSLHEAMFLQKAQTLDNDDLWNVAGEISGLVLPLDLVLPSDLVLLKGLVLSSGLVLLVGLVLLLSLVLLLGLVLVLSSCPVLLLRLVLPLGLVLQAPPLAREHSSVWPQPVWPQTLDPYLQSILEGQEEVPSEGTAGRGPRAMEAAPTSPVSLKKLKTDANIAAAAAVAYATAATSAARAAQAAAQAMQNAPTVHLAAATPAAGTSGPLGVLTGFPGVGAAQGATYNLGEEAALKQEPRDAEMSSLLGPLLPARVPSNLVMSQTLKAARQASTPEEKRSAVQLSMSHLALMPMQHESLKDEFAKLASKLHQRVSYLANMGGMAELSMTLDVLQEKISNLSKSRMKEEELERIWGHQMETMKGRYIMLDKAMSKVQIRLEDLKAIWTHIKNLETEKADKSLVEKELKEKADRGTLATKANRAELKTLSSEVNELVQSLLLRVMAHEDNWKKSVEQLSRELGTKLVRSDLAELKADLNKIRQTLRKVMAEVFHFDPDNAAGFRRKLFEQVQCLSCDRSLDMMTSPHLLTVRKAQLLSMLQPVSANSSEFLQQQQMREQLQDVGTCEDATLSTPQHWANSPESHAGPLLSIYPYGDPSVMDYDRAQVDILGVDGVLYKGRMASQELPPMADGEKDLAGRTSGSRLDSEDILISDALRV
ncbi:uncharacterized protein C16orf96 homolog [Sorex fumeus]|uniref:uncharacterized protein C16orf96 homolog n=1 Tax=Sorex fumeus TaxID=62283 RepID=UPI0024ACEC6D|nr:uncharacterized protein C16orf96 homolog [Sorex fumeus]